MLAGTEAGARTVARPWEGLCRAAPTEILVPMGEPIPPPWFLLVTGPRRARELGKESGMDS